MEHSAFESLLTSILEDSGCQTGTLHRADERGEFLHLVCQIGVPPALLEKITLIPFGKGIAGVAAGTREPVELCNLQQDLGGVAKAGARQTGVAGSLAVPILSPSGDRVLGTLGVGKFVPHDFTAEEKERLARHASRIAASFAGD